MRFRAVTTGHFVTVAAFVSAAILLASCGDRAKHGKEVSPIHVVQGVEVFTVAPSSRESAGEAVGTVRAKTTAAVAPQAMGRLTAVFTEAGARVEAGGLLATIDDQAARAQLASADGALAEAEAAREEADRGVEQAEAGRSLAEKTYGRYRKLLEEKVITPQEFDEVEARRTVAAQERERALRRRAQLDGRIAQARGHVNSARTALAWTRVTAPFAGVIVEKRADAGSMATPGVPLFILEDPRRHRIEAAVSESHLPLLKAGSPVRVTLDADPEREIPAAVTEVVPAIDPATRTFLVKVDLPPGSVRSGQSGRVRYAAGKGSGIAVPKQAVVRSGGSDWVFVLSNDNVVRLSPVTLGAPEGDRVEVLSGLSAGARIAVSPVDRLADGVRAEVRK
ncbi:MAG: efflux RND transporter periplasmic adaptor subunit [Deltaproteobacteria bacterium]|nr:efflux RND transporter periplasmic adaptor subunit [Deltaproteobacteria bacterium]